MPTYILSRLPDNLRHALANLEPGVSRISQLGFLPDLAWGLTLDADRIPERQLTHILMMITGYSRLVQQKDPAADIVNLDVNTLYPDIVSIYPAVKIHILKDRNGRGIRKSGSVPRIYQYGVGTGKSTFGESVPGDDQALILSGEDFNTIKKS